MICNEIKIIIPISQMEKDWDGKSKRKPKTFRLNLNNYNTNKPREFYNNQKRRYKKTLHEILNGLENSEKILDTIKKQGYLFKKAQVDYEIFFMDKRKTDVMNVGSIVDKFALDAIVSYGILEDDNHEYITDQSFKFGGYDEEKKGYAIMTIKEVF